MARRDVELKRVLRQRLPAGSGKAVERGVDAVALSLTFPVPDVQAGGRLLAEVGAGQVVVNAQDRQHLVVEWRLLATTPAADLHRKRREGRADGCRFKLVRPSHQT